MRNPTRWSPGAPSRLSALPVLDAEQRAVLEGRLRRKALQMTLRARALERHRGADPDFIIAGAQKAGSSSLYAYLAAHPQVSPPLAKEIHYFSLWPDRGHAWYRRHFPSSMGAHDITGEASPIYMTHPLAMERIAMDLPTVKIVVILREPVARLISHYRHSVRLGQETLGLPQALASEEGRLAPDLEALAVDPFHAARDFQKFSYLRRSLYLDQVTRIIDLFPGRTLFMRLEDLTDTRALEPLCDFLGIRFEPAVPFDAHNVNTSTPSLAADSIPQDLLDRLADDAAATCELLGWPEWGGPGS